MLLILKRASASRPSGDWSEDDFNVLAAGAVGRPHLSGRGVARGRALGSCLTS
jgi:hypothetical protein